MRTAHRPHCARRPSKSTLYAVQQQRHQRSEQENSSMEQKKILVSGASIAGLTLASWLDRYGFTVTIVEKSGGIRTGGYPIDIRGPARQVVERMGILPDVEGAQIDTQKLQFISRAGRPFTTLRPDELSGSAAGSDLEEPR